MDKTEITRHETIFEKSRKNLLAVVVLTIVNLMLIALNADISFLFSATLPQLLLAIGKSMSSEGEDVIYMAVGLVLACLILLPYLIFWLLSKRMKVFLLAALIYFGIDSLVLLFLIVDMEFTISLLFEIAFHGWILYYLIVGVRAWFNLRRVKAETTAITETKEIEETNILM
jgi:hypothetical protein